MKPTLCLGTAQYGLAYGVTNSVGQVKEVEVKKILREADRTQVEWLDTAQAYGNSEEVLGRNLQEGYNFKIVSKLSAQRRQEFGKEDKLLWEESFNQSCRRLGVKRLDALLLHETKDLLKTGGHFLKDWMTSLKDRGFVNKIGVSIYTPEDLEKIDKSMLDIVQLPLSVYDQRMLTNNTIDRLKESETEIHARSIYLQGLLVTGVNKWPKWLGNKALDHHTKLEYLAKERKCKLLDLAIGFTKEQNKIDAAVIGVCTLKELKQLIEAWERPTVWYEDEWKQWKIDDPHIVDARQWPMI